MSNQPYLLPQTENLSVLYSLVNELSEITAKNKALRNNIVHSIDTMAYSKRPLENQYYAHHEIKTTTTEDDDVIAMNSFLAKFNSQVPYDASVAKSKEELLDILNQQNAKLKEILQSKLKKNLDAYTDLMDHEDALMDVLKCLRENVLEYHMELIKRTREKMGTLNKLEDAEFTEYLKGVQSVEELRKISRAYRELLRIV